MVFTEADSELMTLASSCVQVGSLQPEEAVAFTSVPKLPSVLYDALTEEDQM